MLVYLFLVIQPRIFITEPYGHRKFRTEILNFQVEKYDKVVNKLSNLKT